MSSERCTIRAVDTGGKNDFRFVVDCPGEDAVAQIHASKTKVGGRVAYGVMDIYVNSAYRRRGIATQLYEAAAGEACRRRSRLASTYRLPGAYSNDFWQKQAAKGRVEVHGQKYVLRNCYDLVTKGKVDLSGVRRAKRRRKRA